MSQASVTDPVCKGKTNKYICFYCFIAKGDKDLYQVFSVPKTGTYLLVGHVQIQEADQSQDQRAAREVRLFTTACESCTPMPITTKSIPEIFFHEEAKLIKDWTVYLQFNTKENIKTSSFRAYELCE